MVTKKGARRLGVRKHLVGLLVGITTFNAALLSLPVVAFQVGRAEARWDLWQGKRQFKRCIYWCIQAEPTRKWERMLAERFGFNTITVEDCSPRMHGYDEFQQEEFNRLFGPGALEKEVDDFRQQWLRELRQYATVER